MVDRAIAIIKRFMGGIFAVILIFTLYEAFKPPSPGPGLFPWDKADHFSAFFVLTGLALATFPKQPLWRIAAAMAALGAAIELIQGIPFVHRDCDFWDWVADVSAVLGVYAVVLAVKIRRD